MDWLIDIFSAEKQDTVAHIMLLYSIVIALGIYLGKIKIGGISLGVTFVLFVGILAGHIKFTGPIPVLTFVQDFGLILFVFMIGLQVGPGFFESFGKKRSEVEHSFDGGNPLLNVLVMLLVTTFSLTRGQDKSSYDGRNALWCPVTNTPWSWLLQNEALHSVFKNGMDFDIASGYACAYPLGVVGIISCDDRYPLYL